MSLFAELKRRNVFRVAAAYVVFAWLVIQVVETIFPAFGFGDVAIRVTTIIFAIGLLPALVLAWVFELTPEGLKKEKDLDPSRAGTTVAGKRVDRAIMMVLALALALFAFDKFVLDPQREADLREQKAVAVERAREAGRAEAMVASFGDKSIAVLAFEDMSPEGDQEYLSDGIAEELLNLLAKVPELRVISRSSAFSYKGKDIKLMQVADELNVAHILEGSVRKAGERIRITAQLIDARADTHLWSETYDRRLDDVFAIQDEIAAKVVAQLKIKLLGEAPHVEATDPEAYALRLRARHLARLGTPEGIEQSITLYRQVLAIDPDYAPAWTGLAENYSNQVSFGVRTPDEGLPLAREALATALQIDPDDAATHAMLGWIAMTFETDLAAAARHYERALQLDSTDLGALGRSAMLLVALGRMDESNRVREFVVGRDPVNPTSHYMLGLGYRLSGRWDESIAAYGNALRLSPGRVGAHYGIGTALLLKGDPEAALATYEQETDDEYRVKGQAIALFALGRQEEHELKLLELIERWGEQWPSEVAHVYAYRGEADPAFAWLDRAIEQNEDGLTRQFLEQFYAPLHDDPRWVEFLERAGSAPERLDAITFEVNLPREAQRGF